MMVPNQDSNPRLMNLKPVALLSCIIIIIIIIISPIVSTRLCTDVSPTSRRVQTVKSSANCVVNCIVVSV